jgi:ABC-type protease/lipase transport system fused ATPase/permease subunit
VVAHRPSALHAMHDLLVLTNGQVAAYGTRDEILKKVAGPAAAPKPVPMLQSVPQTRN